MVIDDGCMARKMGVILCCGMFVFCLLTHSFCLFGLVTFLESAFGVAMDARREKGVILCLSSCVMDLFVCCPFAHSLVFLGLLPC